MFFPFLALVSFSHLFPKAATNFPQRKNLTGWSEATANPEVDPQSCSEWPNLEGTYPAMYRILRFFIFLSIK